MTGKLRTETSRRSQVARESARFPLTPLQSAYRIGETPLLSLRTPACLVQGYEVPGLDPERLRDALARLMLEHPALRIAVDGEAQVVRPADPAWAPEQVDWSDLPVSEARARFSARCEDGQLLLPALEDGPQLGCAVYTARETTFVLLALRLFVLDGHAIGVLLRELAERYRGTPPAAGGDADAFRCYAELLERHRATPAHRAALEHWERRVASLPPAPDLPLRPGGLPADAGFARVRHRLAAPSWERFQEHARERGISPNTALCATYTDTLRRWATRRELTITVLVAGRAMLPGAPDADACVGNFGTTLLLADEDRGGSFAARAAALQDRLMEDLPHGLVSAVEVVRRARRSTGRAYEHVPYVFASGLGLDGDESLPHHVDLPGWRTVYRSMRTPQVLLDHQVREEDSELVCNFDHVEAAFPPGLVGELACFHEALLHALADDAAAWDVHATSPLPLPLTSARARANRTARPIRTRGVFERFERHCAVDPDRVALLAPGRRVTRAEASEWILTTAAALEAAEPAPLVGLLAAKSVEQYLAACAIVQHGGAYVPLSVQWPATRIARFLADAGVRRVVVDAEGAALLRRAETDVEPIPLEAGRAERRDPCAALRTPDPHSLAYVIATSGSTGAPKGVAIPHRGLVNTVVDVVDRFGLGPEDRILSLSQLTFDLSAFDLFGALHCGGAVVVPPLGAQPDPAQWAACLRETRATVWNTVPALMEMLLDYLGDGAEEAIASLRLVLLSGDWIPLELPARIRKANPRAEVVALGGATEASIWSNVFPLRAVERSWTSIPYGTPLANQRLHVTDTKLADRPTWTPGELLISGDGLADGYWRAPQLTRERFVTLSSGERAYRTGDRARYLPDGTVELMGRLDLQAKVRGHRVDLLEIERQIATHPDVESAAAVVAGAGARQLLVGFFVARPGAEVDAEALRAHLAAALPAHAIPDVLRTCRSVPLSVNGKRDRRALEALAAAAPSPPTTARGPRGDVECTLVRLWEQVCSVAPRSVDEDFFTVGGSSLLAVQLVHRIEETFGVRIPLSSLFAAPTVAEQARLLQQPAGCNGPAALVPIRQAGAEQVVLVHPVGGNLLCYRPLIEALPETVSIHGLQCPAGTLPARLERLAGRYAAELRAAVDGAPVHLVGWSMGGVIASEMARSLAKAGGAPASVTLVDSYVAAAEQGSWRDEQKAAAAFYRDYLRDSDLVSGSCESSFRAAGDTLRDAGRLHASHAALEPLYEQFSALRRLLLRYSLRALPDCPVDAIRAARQRPEALAPLRPLDEVAGCAAHPLDADHYTIMAPPAARRVAARIGRRLEGGGS